MEPTGWSMAPQALPKNCLDCGERLTAGRKWRCKLCVEAAHAAIRAANGRVVKPSDIQRHRDP